MFLVPNNFPRMPGRSLREEAFHRKHMLGVDLFDIFCVDDLFLVKQYRARVNFKTRMSDKEMNKAFSL